MSMIGKLYCDLFEAGNHYVHQQDGERITSRRVNSEKTVDISNADGLFKVDDGLNEARFVPNDRRAVERILEIIDDVSDAK
ncbi:MAG: hypothetical protein AAF591_19015 [Verrucomicrobiota bacterium]